jgi:hypothetical protein
MVYAMEDHLKQQWENYFNTQFARFSGRLGENVSIEHFTNLSQQVLVSQEKVHQFAAEVTKINLFCVEAQEKFVSKAAVLPLDERLARLEHEMAQFNTFRGEAQDFMSKLDKKIDNFAAHQQSVQNKFQDRVSALQASVLSLQAH